MIEPLIRGAARPSVLRRGRPPRGLCPLCARSLSVTPTVSSGHSKWSKIKHDKGQKDLRKNKQRNVYVRDIVNATKFYGPDPNRNSQLAVVLAKAKQAGMQKSSIEAAILRGQGKSATGAALEPLTVEAVVPPVALIIEGETDKKAQMLMDVRQLLKVHGGTATPTSYMFEKRGRLGFASKDDVREEEVLESILDLGALDVETTLEGGIIVDTEPASLKTVESTLAEKFGLHVEMSETTWVPNKDMAVSGNIEEDTMSDLDQLIEKLESYPGVEGVYTNLAEARA